MGMAEVYLMLPAMRAGIPRSLTGGAAIRLAWEQERVEMNARYQFDAEDDVLLQAAATLLKKLVGAEALQPAQLVSVAKLQHVLSRLPRVTSGVEVTVSVASPRSHFAEIETWHWWDVGVEGEQLSISSGGHFSQTSSGGDAFSTMSWAAIPEAPSVSEDHSKSLWMVPDICSFSDGVASIHLSAGGYKIEVTDEDNPLLEEECVDDDDVAEETESQ